jgi:hypothetical protein
MLALIASIFGNTLGLRPNEPNEPDRPVRVAEAVSEAAETIGDIDEDEFLESDWVDDFRAVIESFGDMD